MRRNVIILTTLRNILVITILWISGRNYSLRELRTVRSLRRRKGYVNDHITYINSIIYNDRQIYVDKYGYVWVCMGMEICIVVSSGFIVCWNGSLINILLDLLNSFYQIVYFLVLVGLFLLQVHALLACSLFFLGQLSHFLLHLFKSVHVCLLHLHIYAS